MANSREGLTFKVYNMKAANYSWMLRKRHLKVQDFVQFHLTEMLWSLLCEEVPPSGLYVSSDVPERIHV